MINRVIFGSLVAAYLCTSVTHAATTAVVPPPVVQKTAPAALPPPAISTSNNLIARTPVTLTVVDAILADGDAVDLKATLRNKATSAPLANETIEFKILGKTVAVIKTDASGLGWVKGHKAPSDMALGAHLMEAHFAGTNTFATATAKGNFTLLVSNTELKLDPPTFLDSVVHPGYEGHFTGTLVRGTDKTGLPGRKLRFLIGDTEVAISKPYEINANNGAFFAYFIWPKDKLGEQTVKVVFDATEKLLASSSKSFKIKSSAASKPGTMTLDVSVPAVFVGDKITLTAKLRESLVPGLPGFPGLPVVGETVVFAYADGQKIGTAVSAQNGDAILQTTMTQSSGNKPVAFAAKLNKNNGFYSIAPVESQTKLLILPSAVKLTVTAPSTGLPGQIISIKLKLGRSSDNAPVAGSVLLPHYFANGNPGAVAIGIGGGGIQLPFGSVGGSGSTAPKGGNFNFYLPVSASGEATAQYKLPDVAGSVTIESKSAGNENYNSAVGNTITISVK